MKNLKQRIKEAGIITSIIVSAAIVTGVSEYLDSRRMENSRVVQEQWQKRMQELKEKDCASAYHYGNMHGHYIEGLGWSEERCPYAF